MLDTSARARALARLVPAGVQHADHLVVGAEFERHRDHRAIVLMDGQRSPRLEQWIHQQVLDRKPHGRIAAARPDGPLPSSTGRNSLSS
ncbi:MAG: hypothetical protein ACRDK8_05075 [Solirubrobacteraceae bacterium]